MVTALKRAARKPQKYGLHKFIGKISVRNAIGDIFGLFLLRIQKVFYMCKIQVKQNEVVDHKNTAKSLRKDIKKEKLRSTRANVRTFQEVLKKLMRRTLNIAHKRVIFDESKERKFSIISMINIFVLRPKQAFDN